jgi:DNA-damage-inducible protein D
MTNLTHSNPFDSIRHEDEQGEYWLATELLTLFGYKTWKRQRETAERAIVSCENSGNNSALHFKQVVQMAQIGDSQACRSVVKDYKLSRLGCYLTAMNGDSRKPEIASAQSYFAIKTREAETIIPVQEDRLLEQKLRIRELELQLALTRESRQIMEKREAIIQMNSERRAAFILGAQVVEPPPEVIEKTVAVDLNGKQLASFDGVGIGYIRERYGFRHNAQAWQWLESIGYSKDSKWIQELTAVQSAKLPRRSIEELDKLFQTRQGNRQMLIGE